MKIIITISIHLFSGLLLAQSPECLTEGSDPFKLNQKQNVETFLKVAELSIKEKQKAYVEKETADVKKFLAALPEENRKQVDSILAKLKSSESDLINIVENDGAPVLFVKGLDLEEFPSEWVKPLAHAIDKKQLSYFFRWSKFNSLEKNRDDLISIIRSLLASHPDQELTIIGYSAGGVITTHAMSELKDDPVKDRIKFHTIASPLYGYNAPVFALLGMPFVGKTTIEIGMGASEKLKNKTLNNCRHWINLDCEKDMHACDYRGMKPFTGAVDQQMQMPCGNENVKTFSDEGHGSILNRVVKNIIN